MTTQLTLYNGALRLVGERRLSALTENREPKRYLDEVWDDDAVDYCLEQGLWNFATRTVKLDYNSSLTPPFGYERGFDVPDDFIRTVAVCQDEFFKIPLLDYAEESGFFFSNLDSIYVQYVSNDDNYGRDFSLWPQSFVKYVSSYLASEIVERLVQSETKLGDIFKIMTKRLMEAKSKDSMESPTKFTPAGSWSNARHRGQATRRDRGSSNTLY